jgi:hypothetical protein
MALLSASDRRQYALVPVPTELFTAWNKAKQAYYQAQMYGSADDVMAVSEAALAFAHLAETFVPAGSAFARRLHDFATILQNKQSAIPQIVQQGGGPSFLRWLDYGLNNVHYMVSQALNIPSRNWYEQQATMSSDPILKDLWRGRQAAQEDEGLSVQAAEQEDDEDDIEVLLWTPLSDFPWKVVYKGIDGMDINKDIPIHPDGFRFGAPENVYLAVYPAKKSNDPDVRKRGNGWIVDVEAFAEGRVIIWHRERAYKDEAQARLAFDAMKQEIDQMTIEDVAYIGADTEGRHSRNESSTMSRHN